MKKRVKKKKEKEKSKVIDSGRRWTVMNPIRN
jgi:hypothetical protein